MKGDGKVHPVIGMGVIFAALWLAGLIGFLRFESEAPELRAGIPQGAPPIVAGDVPPAPVFTVASGGHGNSRWSVVASAAGGLRCFGLETDEASYRVKFACNRRVLEEGEPFGGTVFAPSELTKPILFGEAFEGVSAVRAVWGKDGSRAARMVERAVGHDARIKLFVVLLPRDIRRLHLVAHDADSEVIGRVRVCCPPRGVRSAPMLPLCHGKPTSRLRTPVRRESRGGLGELMACPPVDLIRGVEFVSSPTTE